MSAEHILNVARNECNSIALTDSYLKKQYKNNFGFHLNGLLELCLALNNDSSFVLRQPGFKMSESFYYEIEGYILERLDDISEDLLDELDVIEDGVKNKIIDDLGTFYNGDSELDAIINYSVDGFILATKFELMSRASSFHNPWNPSKAVLLHNKFIHKFSTDMSYIADMGSPITRVSQDGESEVLKNTHIGLVAKGRKDGFSTALYRDLFGLRNTLLDVMSEIAPNSERPANAHAIVRTLRQMGLSETDFSDSNIRSWLLYPLKRMSKIGSNKEGYFLLESCVDIHASYVSHLENFKGFLRTLESHRDLGRIRNCSANLDMHRQILRQFLDSENS
jgi:hypothetical protein